MEYLLNEVINYGAIISYGVSFVLIMVSVLLKRYNRKIFFYISLASLILGTAISGIYYPMQINASMLNILYPISLLVLLILIWMGDRVKVNISKILYVAHCALLMFGLDCLNTRANTWGNFGLWMGVFITSNSVLILLLLTFLTGPSKFYGIVRIAAGIMIFPVLWNRNFIAYEGDFCCDDFDILMRRGSLVISALMMVEGGLIVWGSNRGE